MERKDGYYSRKVFKSCPTRLPKAEREGNDINDREFAVIATRLIWGESEAEPTPQETIKRLKDLAEERDLYLWALKDISEALLKSARWAEGEACLAKALLWGLYALQDRQALVFKSVPPPAGPPSTSQSRL